jgi:hypothetical protein
VITWVCWRLEISLSSRQFKFENTAKKRLYKGFACSILVCMKKPVLLTILWICALLFSCRVVLVPEYSSELEAQIVQGAKLNDKLYIDLLNANPDKRSFQLYAGKYAEVESEIHSILLKNETRKKNNDMLVIIRNLDSAFVEYKNQHKSQDRLSDGEIKVNQAFIKAFWKPLLIAESGLKKAKTVTR